MRQAPTAMPAERRVLWLLALSAAAVFVIRAVPWVLSDLWYDEIVTFIDFAVGPPRGNTILRVFRFYPVANNHVLFSALAWCWVPTSAAHAWCSSTPSRPNSIRSLTGCCANARHNACHHSWRIE